MATIKLGCVVSYMRSRPLLISCYSSTAATNRYDLVVVGGGSGGLACAKEASILGKKVAVVDYVEPTIHGTKWGLGGTCVNVGCIPKKLMHEAARLGQSLHDARYYGWLLPSSHTHSWETLRNGVQDYIKSLNWGQRVQLKEKNIDYVNGKAYFHDDHNVEVLLKSGKKRIINADKFVVAVGGRPRIPQDVPGALKYAITSDDLFTLQKPPGKTLIIGAGYIALECAGFLSGIGYEVSVMVRSVCLRSFDQDMVSLLVENMTQHGIVFINKSRPLSITKAATGKLEIRYINSETGAEKKDYYDNVMFAIGRDTLTTKLELDKVNVALHPESNKIIAKDEKTTCPNIYAVGDVLHGQPELTPVAIQAGKLLAKRLFSGSLMKMDYTNVPTTIFTPLEYGCVGLSEEKAAEIHSKDVIEIYHAFYTPLEYTVAQKSTKHCYIKVICLKSKNNLIIGMHFLGPNAGEVIQGFTVAMQCDVTYEQLCNTTGIHPTCAEEIIKLRITRSSGEDPTVTAC